MNEVQLYFQAFSINEKKKRDSNEDVRNFLFYRDRLIEFLGVNLDVEPERITLGEETVDYKYSIPIIHLLSPLIGGDNIKKIIDSLEKSINGAKSVKDNPREDFDLYVNTLAEGNKFDDISREYFGGESVDEILERMDREAQEKESARVLDNSDQTFDDIKRSLLVNRPKEDKKINFIIKSGDDE